MRSSQPANTLIVAPSAMSSCGAVPVSLVVDSGTYAMDATLLERAITDGIRGNHACPPVRPPFRIWI
jgi:dTDP-4-amino-4,6-dideoxygalactose transaminase